VRRSFSWRWASSVSESLSVGVVPGHGGRDADDARAEKCRDGHGVVQPEVLTRKPTTAGPARKAAKRSATATTDWVRASRTVRSGGGVVVEEEVISRRCQPSMVRLTVVAAVESPPT
jgi:hypothetical protein